jgi:proteasome lid subunit RPN8/RPN11
MNGHININMRHELLDQFDGYDGIPERCALLLGSFREEDDTYVIDAVVEVKNSHREPLRHFTIKKKDAQAALEALDSTDSSIIGHLHTHPKGTNADPSYEDCINMPDNMVGVIYHPHSRTITYYNRQGFISKEKHQ